jgi:hypothetical protein
MTVTSTRSSGGLRPGDVILVQRGVNFSSGEMVVFKYRGAIRVAALYYQGEQFEGRFSLDPLGRWPLTKVEILGTYIRTVEKPKGAQRLQNVREQQRIERVLEQEDAKVLQRLAPFIRRHLELNRLQRLNQLLLNPLAESGSTSCRSTKLRYAA